MEYIKVTKENLENEHICCAISNNKDIQVSSKKEWLENCFDDGLVFLKSTERGKCFIEYIPAENAWVPIIADNYMYIDCFWVSGSFKGHGYSNDLLNACIKDSKEKGKLGICILSSDKKRPFLSDPKHLAYKGFKVADTSDVGINLMYFPFDEKSNVPKFKSAAKHPSIKEEGFVLYYTSQCPFNAKYVPILEKTAIDNNIPFKTIHIKSKQQAQAVSSPCTSYALFHDGKFVTNEQFSQKTFCANFLTKQMVKNTGQIPQYYVENSHPEIIDPDEWNAVQAEISRRKSIGAIGRCTSPFAGKIICGDCGGFYGKKVWGSYKEDKTYRREVYRCNDMYKHTRRCESPIVTEEEIKEHFLLAFNTLMSNRDSIVEDCRLARSTLCDTKTIDAELTELTREIEVVTELSRKAIYENARTVQSQSDFNKRNEDYLKRHSKATKNIKKLEKEKQERLAKSKTLERFIADIEKRPLVLADWDEGLWLIAVDSVIVKTDGLMTFRFKGGAEITT